MNTLPLALLGLALAPLAWGQGTAQDPYPAPPDSAPTAPAPAPQATTEPAPPPPQPSMRPPSAGSNLDQLPALDQLVAPIALYPDPVIALMLPAAAYPSEIQAAAANPYAAGLDPSVQGLTHYPDVLQWMGANMAWTQQLGSAFAANPSGIMGAIQDLRQKARAAGTLVPSAYETVTVDANGQIQILPAQPNEVYIPSYDPNEVYWGGYGPDVFAWGAPYPAGAWLSYNFDWRGGRLWQGDWYGYYHGERGWNRPPVDFNRGNVGAYVRGGARWNAPAPAVRSYSQPRGYSGYARPQVPRQQPARSSQSRSAPESREEHRP